MYTVIIDTKGSDKGPHEILKGAVKALDQLPELKVVLVGDTDVISKAMEEVDPSRYEILEACDVITNFDHPALAISQKSQSSLVVALKALRDRDDACGLINAGSTGALLVGSLKYLSGKVIQRPCLAAVLPAAKGGFVCLVDTGANVDCTSDNLVQFAHLGSAFMKDLYKIDKARVGLLSNGSEPTKGNRLVKETHQRLAEDKEINFVGNIEGTNALSGDCDVLVCDGFSGNQVLKNSEGIATRIIKDIYKLNVDGSYTALIKKLMGLYDFNSLGGGIVLGVSKTVIKAHGACNENSIASIATMLVNLASNKAMYQGEN